MTLTIIDHVKGTIALAIVEGLTLDDLWLCIEHAENIEAFDNAVNILANTMPQQEIDQYQYPIA